jgi:hypothetical protein
MKHFFLTILALITFGAGYAQFSYPISTYGPTPRPYRNLLLTNQQIEDNDTINEEIIDLVQPIVMDSVLGKKKKPHHRLFLVGWLINKFGGYGWRPVEPVKQKYVGTVREDGHSGDEQFTEYDINYTIVFHQHDYLFKMFKAYNKQAHIHRQDIRTRFFPKKNKPDDYTVPPFVRDTNNLNLNQYSLHCEITPPREFRSPLNYLFYPVLSGYGIAEHPNFMTNHPTMGFYGASCLDCNHSCHPEIHPYEWIWWMNLHNGTVKDKTFLLGMLKESSNRFPGWSENPKTGKTTIPFSFEVKDPAAHDRVITIEHLVFNRFISANLARLDIPANAFDAGRQAIDIQLKDDKGFSIPLTVRFNYPLIGAGIRYWISDVNWDAQSHIVSGLLHVATSVKDLYTMKVTLSGQ